MEYFRRTGRRKLIFLHRVIIYYCLVEAKLSGNVCCSAREMLLWEFQ